MKIECIFFVSLPPSFLAAALKGFFLPCVIALMACPMSLLSVLKRPSRNLLANAYPYVEGITRRLPHGFPMGVQFV